jgi:hypothetical protein
MSPIAETPRPAHRETMNIIERPMDSAGHPLAGVLRQGQPRTFRTRGLSVFCTSSFSVNAFTMRPDLSGGGGKRVIANRALYH